MASSSSVRARAWVLNAEFDIAEHPLLADPDSNQIFSEYVKGIFRGRDPHLANNMKGTTLISISMPTTLSSLSNRDVVPVLGIFHGSHAVKATLPRDPGGMTIEHSHSTQRSGRNDERTQPLYPEIRAE